jgi:hypothetical protein
VFLSLGDSLGARIDSAERSVVRRDAFAARIGGAAARRRHAATYCASAMIQ